MICNEKIEKVYKGQPNHSDSVDGYFLDCVHKMTLHLTENYRLVFETKNYYISVESDDIKCIEKTGPVETIEKENECLYSFYDTSFNEADDSPWVEYEWTLFCGEKIESVIKNDTGYDIKFTDFILKVKSHRNDEIINSFCTHVGDIVLGTERLINPCSCGGRAILELDVADDYGIRCLKCGLGTGACCCACDAIEYWNDPSSEKYKIRRPVYEQLIEQAGSYIEFIDISWITDNLNDDEISTDRITISINGRYFSIESRLIDTDESELTFDLHSSYNRYFVPNRVSSEKWRLMKLIDISKSCITVCVNDSNVYFISNGNRINIKFKNISRFIKYDGSSDKNTIPNIFEGE